MSDEKIDSLQFSRYISTGSNGVASTEVDTKFGQTIFALWSQYW